ncbi:pilus assembly protein N-terminal domain-containing protein [Pseudidiomarina marina]|uniref:type II and III secretion system protein family protein n=1 Tax=Pseudidiomarina marina TaxID=502366 RepID=UPI00384F1BE8
MRSINLFLAIILAISVNSAHALNTLSLKVGETQIISLKGVSDVVVGNENLLKVELLPPHDLVIKAISSGYTELLVRYESGSNDKIPIVVNAPLDKKEQLHLQWLKQQYSQLQFDEKAGTTVISGQLPQLELEQFKRAIIDYPDWLIQVSEVPAAIDQMIELQVTILEVKRQSAQHLGIKWQHSISGPTLSDASAQWVTFPITLLSTVNLLVQNGHARILAEPKLIAASGGQADFLVGGEFPIPQVLAQGAQDVEFRDYGISLSMSPHDLGGGQISTEIKAQISTIDPATAIQGIPGMLTRRVSSLITAKSGEAIILSGLLSQEQSLQAESFPLLHQIPILGELFSSREFRDAETELFVVVTPLLQSHQRQTQQSHEHAKSLIKSFRDNATCVGLTDGF